LIDSYSLEITTPIDVTLEVNGSQPPSRLVSTAGPFALTLDMDPGSVDDTLVWAVGFMFGQQLRYMTPGGGTTSTPQAVATSVPLQLSNAPLLSTNLPSGSSVLSFLFGLNGGRVDAFDYICATRSFDPGPRVRLEANGEHPETNIVTTAGAVTLTLDVDPQGAVAPLDWYFARILGGQFRFIGPGGTLSVQPVVFASGPPAAVADQPLPAGTIAAGQTAVFFYYGTDVNAIEALDCIVVRRTP
jgi:hypothetical protein